MSLKGLSRNDFYSPKNGYVLFKTNIIVQWCFSWYSHWDRYIYNSENDDVGLDFYSSIFCWQIPIHNIQNLSVPGQAAQSLPLTQVRWNSFYSSVVSVSIHLRFQSFTLYAESVKNTGFNISHSSFWIDFLLPYGGLLKWGYLSIFFSAFPWKKPSSYWATHSLGNLHHLLI